jgi:hypothetical protein
MDPVQVIRESIVEGTQFGTLNPDKLGALTVKCISLIVPGIVIGHYIDQWVEVWKRQQSLGTRTLPYVAVQTMANVVAIYVMARVYRPYTDEFQNTYAGLFFSALLFGMQSNYVGNLQTLLGKV